MLDEIAESNHRLGQQQLLLDAMKTDLTYLFPFRILPS